jgi:trehalose-6-phosphatase
VGREPAASPPVVYTQHHDEADPNFGSCRDKELLDHLDNVLNNEPVVVKRGQHIVEVNPQGISKGTVDVQSQNGDRPGGWDGGRREGVRRNAD